MSGPERNNERSGVHQVKHPPRELVPLGPLPPKPLVSIIVPSFNQGRFIRDTIDSILAQDYRPLQLIVIDGASTDETVAVLQSYGEQPELEWVSEPDRGVAEAVNKGLARARGEILAIQSSDDAYLQGAISTMVEACHAWPRCGLLYADFETVDAAGNALHRSSLRPYSLHCFLTKQTWIPQPAAVFRREMIEACGGWDERYFTADTELWLRMVFRTQVRKIDCCIARRRLHDSQRNRCGAEIVESYRRMIRNSPDLRASPWTLRRAAWAGAYLHGIKYAKPGDRFDRTRRTWAALVVEPKLWSELKNSPFLFPGMNRLRRFAAGIRGRGREKPVT